MTLNFRISHTDIHTYTLRIHSNKINPTNIYSRENHQWMWIKISQNHKKNYVSQFHLVPILRMQGVLPPIFTVCCSHKLVLNNTEVAWVLYWSLLCNITLVVLDCFMYIHFSWWNYINELTVTNFHCNTLDIQFTLGQTNAASVTSQPFEEPLKHTTLATIYKQKELLLTGKVLPLLQRWWDSWWGQSVEGLSALVPNCRPDFDKEW